MSSPLPYTPYQSHRRGASSVSSTASAAAAREQHAIASAAATPSSLASSSSSPKTGSFPQSVTSSANLSAGSTRSVSQRLPSEGLQRAQGSPLYPSATTPASSASANGSAITGSLKSTRSRDAPPPLRKASAIRPSSLLASDNGNGLPVNGKGKAREGPKSPLGQSEPRSSLVAPSNNAGASSSSSMTPSVLVTSRKNPTGSDGARVNGHNKRHSSFSPAALIESEPLRSHNRTSSGGNLALSLPQHISTAQRLRSTTTPASGSSATSSPTDTPRSHSPGAGPHFRYSPELASHLQTQNEALFQESLGRKTAYRHGFQPKGVYRVRTDEFAAARTRRRQTGRSFLSTGGESIEKASSELETQRLERRLEKLVALHYETPPTLSEEASAEKIPTWLPNSIRRVRIHAEEDRLMREEEQHIVKWEDDSARKNCPHCNNPFSFTVRKHHCRLCGRIVCASPHLPLPPNYPVSNGAPPAVSDEEKQANEAKCSGLIVAVPSRQGRPHRKIRDVPRWDEVRIQGQEGDLRFCTMRICKDCRETIMHRQYMLDDGAVPQYLKLYETLVTLQKEIEQSLPEFQEMVLGLQKQDAAAALGTDDTQISDPLEPPSGALSASSIAAAKAKNRTTLALQRDAAQARKQLLANFANYDLIAKKIRNLDDDGNASLGRLKTAIATRANMFLQANMFPLQNLPKLSTTRPTPNASKPETATQKPSRRSSSHHEQGSPNEAVADARAREMVANDPAAALESLSVLEQQLSLVRQYAASAAKTRKFQDASSLQASAHELETEITRLRRLGVR